MSIPIHLSFYNAEPGTAMLHHTACGTWGELVTTDPKKVECGNCRRTEKWKKKKKAAAMTSIERTNLLHKVVQATNRFSSYDRTLGFLRYETVRKMRSDQFACLHKENLQTNTPFDTLIDRLILQQP